MSSFGAGRVEVHYQPIVDLLTGATAGVEALARWRDVDGTLRAPAEFIAFAEQTALIHDIGRDVRTLAIPQVVRWSQQLGRALQLHVNVSADEIGPALIDEIVALQRSHGPACGQLVLEVTETRPIHDIGGTAATLRLLRERGVRIAIDDFGSGWANMERVRGLDVDVIKIDRCLIHRASRTTRQDVKMLLGYARRHGITVVAEGIEDPETRRWLHDAGCDFGQGFLFAPPAAAPEIELRLGRPDHRPLAGGEAGSRSALTH